MVVLFQSLIAFILTEFDPHVSVFTLGTRSENPLQDLGGDWRFLKILSKGEIGTDINFRGGMACLFGDKFFQGGLRAYHVNVFLF